MREYWLDPPEYPEQPECLECEDGFMEDEGDNKLVCDSCGATVVVDPPMSPEDEEILRVMEEDIGQDDPVPKYKKCPHGNDWGECDTCDYLGDIAYDSARESRGR